MKVIFNYTIPHTGTHFVMDLLRQGYDSYSWSKIDDEWLRSEERRVGQEWCVRWEMYN